MSNLRAVSPENAEQLTAQSAVLLALLSERQHRNITNLIHAPSAGLVYAVHAHSHLDITREEGAPTR